MTQVNKIDSNRTELAYAEELSFGALPVTPIWRPLEPNSYTAFGGDIKTVARNPINADRQRRKGVTVDLDSKAEFETDVTQSNLEHILQGFFFASLKRTAELGGASQITAVVAAGSSYTIASGGTALRAGDMVMATNFTNAANNGLKRVTGTVLGTSVPVVETCVNENAPPATATLTQVGFQFTSGDATIVASAGTFPRLVTSTKNLTELGITPGEWVFIGGTAVHCFVTAACNGFARVRSVTATTMTFDKTYTDFVSDTGASQTIQIWFGRVLKNQTGTNIVRRTYQLERKLGASDDSNLSQIQSEYVTGAVPSEFELGMKEAKLVAAKLKFVGAGHEPRSGVTGVKSGTRATLVAEDAFNGSSDVSVTRVSTMSATNSNQTPLVGYFTELTMTLKNNISANKAIGELGSFDASAGTFDVKCEIKGYFPNVSALTSVRNNDTLTFDSHLVKNNAGISIDLPCMIASKSLAEVKQDEPIMLPLDSDAASGFDVNTALNHTALMVFFPYLPSLADS